MKHWKNIALLVLCVGFIVGWGGGVWTNDWNGVKIGKGDTGQKINLLETFDLAFAGDTTKTATVTVPSGGTYRVFATWKTNGGTGVVKVSISGQTLTATASTATTGTLSVLVIGLP